MGQASLDGSCSAFCHNLAGIVESSPQPGAGCDKAPLLLGRLLLLVAAVCALYSGLTKGLERRAFVGSNLLLIGLLIAGSAAFFPVMLYSTLAPGNSLTAYSLASGSKSLLLASFWWPVGFVLATIYFVFISRRYAGKVSVVRDNQGYY
jgi:cytochrome bd-type quinol oxidase subunit 2